MIKNSIYIPKNILRGITPTASGWGTSPTNLGNITDGDVSTVTGTGSTNALAKADYGFITFDLGSIKQVMFGCRVGIWCASARDIILFAAGSDDNVTYRDTLNANGPPAAIVYRAAAPNAEEVVDSLINIINGRYIRIRFLVTGASNTANAKIYEAWAYELGK